MSCFPFPTSLLTLISSKNALSFLWKPLSSFFSRWHVVISAWLLLMQFNLILLETSYSSYICFIIQQLIGTFHNCWYEKDKKKHSSLYTLIHLSWTGFTYLEFGKYAGLQISPCLYGRGDGTRHQNDKSVHKAAHGGTQADLAARDKECGRSAQLKPSHNFQWKH